MCLYMFLRTGSVADGGVEWSADNGDIITFLGFN